MTPRSVHPSESLRCDDGEDAAGDEAEDRPEGVAREALDVDEREADQTQHRERDAIEQRLRREDGGGETRAARAVALRWHLHADEVADARRDDVVREIRDEQHAEQWHQRRRGEPADHQAPSVRDQ
jgi:hypothetical protein